MAVLSGRILMINNQAALVPILLADLPPLPGLYAGWPGATVTAICYVPIGVIGEIEVSFSATTADNGTYSITVDLPEPLLEQPVSVAITVSFGVLVYRSGLVPLDTVSNGALNFWIYPFPVSPSDGITAGTISNQLSNGPISLPSDTTLTTSPAGLDVSFSETADLVDAWFGVAVQPDSSPNLQSFVDLSLRYVNIVDLLPGFIHPNAGDILQGIENGVGGAASALNQQVLTMMENDLEQQDNVNATIAQRFFTQDVSVTFTNITFTNYTWNITATGDKTVVMNATLCIGFPRNPTPGELAL